MFKLVVLILSLAGQPLGYGISNADFASKAECEAQIPAAVQQVTRDIPNRTYKAACLDKAVADKLEAADKGDDGSI